MFTRVPLILRRRPRQLHTRRPHPPAPPPPSTTTGSDFACYTDAELQDRLWAASAAAEGSPSLPRRQWRSLHSGADVPALPASHAILNHVNSAVWLQVLPRLHERGALSSDDCAGAMRYVSAFTYRPIMPWLWRSSALPAAHQHADNSGGSTSAASTTGLEAEVYDNMTLVALERSRGAAHTSTTGDTTATPCTRYIAADLGVAHPAQWATVAAGVVASAVASASTVSLQDVIKAWQDALFAVRLHAVWAGTPEDLHESAHPQLMSLFTAFYADVRRHRQRTQRGDACADEQPQQRRRHDGEDVATVVEVHTLTPPILLRKLRSLYRTHHGSSALFAELYALCVQGEEEEVHVRLHRAPASDAAGNAAAPRDTLRRHLTTTALLMDVDLATYYATLAGRRHSGHGDAGAQWEATLQHLRFQLPRVHLQQRCLAATAAAAGAHDTTVVWQPWQQIAAVVANVCVWVSNNNKEAERCCDVLRCLTDALSSLCAAATTADATSGGSVHTLLGAPTSGDVAAYVSHWMDAARASMRAKAAQLQYGPTDGLLGVHLLSVAVAAVLPPAASAPEAAERNTDDAASALTQRLRLLSHHTKSTPTHVWAALRRSPGVAEATRHGLVTVGSRLFSECVVPLAKQPQTLATAQRVWRCLRAWATEVGRPLDLCGEAVSVLWLLRWARERGRTDAVGSSPSHTVADPSAVLHTLTATDSATVSWRCGCGFDNSAAPTTPGHHAGVEASSMACTACVLRHLSPTSWECPSCHTASTSGVCVPYCLHCGEAHPRLSAGAHNAVTCAVPEHGGAAALSTDTGSVQCCWDCGHLSSEAPVPCAAAGGVEEGADESCDTLPAEALVYVCSSCSAISAAGPHAAAQRQDTCGADGACSGTHCSSCGSTEPGYYTAAFTWMCGCGAGNSALHAYCHACSRAAQVPTVTCTHCHHAQRVSGGGGGGRGGACERCGHPHPRQLAAVRTHRLVRCPACHGRAPPDCRECPHCESTAVAAVAPLLPTEADRPWLCHRCGATHPVRDAADGRLCEPVHLAATASLRVAVPLPHDDRDDRCCTACGTPRLHATVWESGRLWACDECGAAGNMGLACRQCAALAPGLDASDVYVWCCAACGGHHPGWERRCTTPGCGAHRDDDACARLPYAPRTCAECGDVSLAVHTATCAGCGAVVDGAVPEASTARPPAAPAAPSPATPPPPPHGATRLAAVEVYLLQAAALAPPPSPLLQPRRSHGGVDVAQLTGSPVAVVEPWEDAYAATVLSF
ncbi:hypothetical protein NESM_000763100 [Novymonas esmeraldas]|uniref:RanBP2-type domain-containing protein n=1 Tax=Novymonas esmeraldas TaxID=1808958 RepID=A0AAW0EYY1_9TRYP